MNVWAFNVEWIFSYSLFLSKIEMRIVSSVSMDIREYDTNKLGHKGQNGKFMWCMWSWVLIFVDIVCTQIEKWKTCVRTPSCHRRVCFGMIIIVFPIWCSRPIIPFSPYTIYRRRRGILTQACASLVNKQFSHIESFILILKRCVCVNNACFFFMDWPSMIFPAWLRFKAGRYLFYLKDLILF